MNLLLAYCPTGCPSSLCTSYGTCGTGCPAGQFLQSSFCFACNAGTWSTAGSTSCTYCSQGTWSSTIGASTSTACVGCNAGTWSMRVGASYAAQCSSTRLPVLYHLCPFSIFSGKIVLCFFSPFALSLCLVFSSFFLH